MTPWDAVKLRLRLKDVDPRLWRDRLLPQVLLKAEPPGGYPAVPNGVLTLDFAWELIMEFALGMRPLADVTRLLGWCGFADTTAFLSADRDLRRKATDYLRERCGPLTDPILSCLEAECNPLHVGLALAALPNAEAARARLEKYHGVTSLSLDLVRLWADRSVEVTVASPQELLLEAVHHADQLLAEIHATEHAHESCISAVGLDQRVSRFGDDLLRLQADASLEERAHAVQTHRLIAQRPIRAEQVQMALRLVRWLAEPMPALRNLTEAATWYVTTGSFVDQARHRLTGGDVEASVSAAYQKLLEVVGQRREQLNQSFATLLRDWSRIGDAPPDLLPVETVLERVVAPLSQVAPVLLVVLDGASWPVLRQLGRDLPRYGWAPIQPEKAALGAVITALPSITLASRCSLLSGRLVAGEAAAERQNFSSFGVLYHKAGIESGDMAVLSQELTDDLANPKKRVVAVVVNAIDDTLAKDGQMHHEWRIDSIRPLESLLLQAQREQRVVVLASDHGHILERGTTLQPGGNADRWRPAKGDIAAGEMLFEGPRVLAGGSVCLPWTERIRYCSKKNGYHGGATMQEVVAPLLAIAPIGLGVQGWIPSAPAIPAWWEAEAKAIERLEVIATPAPVKPTARRGSKKRAPDPLSGMYEQAMLGETPDWIRQAVKGKPDEARLARMLTALDAADGKLPGIVLAQYLQMSEIDFAGFLVNAYRVLSPDGYASLEMRADNHVILNRDLLLRQFEPRRIVVQPLQGTTFEFTLPIDVSTEERQLLEMLARYGRMAEGELRQKTGNRRIAGVVQGLLARLRKAGWQGLAEDGDGDQGTIYSFKREKV
ncbi:MAG: BREX-2 system phosphatase PglZ [Candidatus Xenobia bacterium]